MYQKENPACDRGEISQQTIERIIVNGPGRKLLRNLKDENVIVSCELDNYLRC